jgi:hypothetical protein
MVLNGKNAAEHLYAAIHAFSCLLGLAWAVRQVTVSAFLADLS